MSIYANQKQPTLSQNLDRAVRLLIIILVVSVVSFGIYYYTDRLTGPSSPSLVDQAIVDLEELIRLSPKDPNLRTQVGLAYVERGYFDAAVEQYQVALEMNPSNNAALIGMGNAYLAKKDYGPALAAFDQVIELNKDNPFRKTLRQLEAVYYRIGFIRGSLGEYAAAEASLREALAIDHTDADAWFVLGEVLRKQDKGPDALEAYNETVSLDPLFTAAYEGMGQIFTQSNQPALLAYATGMVAITKGDYQKAIPLLEKAASGAPDFAGSFLGLGLAYEKADRVTESVQAFRTALRLAPGNFLAEVSLQRTHAQLLKSEVK